MTYKAVLFDLDGTLLDTIEDIADSMNLALEKIGCPTHDTDTYKKFIGRGADRMVKNALPENKRDNVIIGELISSFEEDYEKRATVKTRPYEGVVELLNKLENMNIKMAILSNKPDKFTKAMVKELLGKWKFESVMGVGIGFPFKPDPASSLEVAKKMNLKPEECIFLGDMIIDINTAKNAGMFPVGALWGFSSQEELLASGAQKLIKNPLELLELF